MHSGTRSYITVYDYTQAEFEGLERGTNIHDSDFFEDVVPHRKEWGEVNHIELDDLEYDPWNQQLSFSCQTKWHGPVNWLRAASCTEFFTNRLMTMATITRDETNVDAVAVIDRDLLQDRNLVQLESETVGAMYENDEVDELDHLLWDPINEFNKECEELYLVPEGE